MIWFGKSAERVVAGGCRVSAKQEEALDSGVDDANVRSKQRRSLQDASDQRCGSDADDRSIDIQNLNNETGGQCQING